VLLGGVLPDGLGWQWGPWVTVPIGLIAAAIAPILLAESRSDGERRYFDFAGAVSITAGLSLLVYSVLDANNAGWGSTRTISLLALAAVLIVAFIWIERRSAHPLVPFRIFRVRTVTGANVVGFLLAAVVFSNFFVLTLYVQQVLGWSALKAGVTFVATAGTVVVVAGLVQMLVTRIGVKPVLTIGLALEAGAMLWYAQIPVHGSYGSDLLPGYLMMGFGLAFSFIPVSIAALAGVEVREAGLASGLINTSQQIGGAIGVAAASTLITSHAKTLLHSGHSPAEAFTSGYRWAFWMLAGVAIAGVIATLTLIRRDDLAEIPAAVPTAG
jgi:MFS family permease